MAEPKCPYCGSKMTGELEEGFHGVFEYLYACTRCGSTAPLVLVENDDIDKAKIQAFQKALHRADVEEEENHENA